MYNLRKRPGMEKSEEALKGSQEKEDRHDAARPKVVVQKPSKSRPKAKIDRPIAKVFSSLPRHLQELVLLKTSTQTRLKLFKVNEQLREWVFEEGLFPRDVQRIETAYRPQRPREKILGNDSLRIFKILPRSGLADIVEIDAVEAKSFIVFKNIRSCLDLMVRWWGPNYFRVSDFFPNLRFLGTFDIYGIDEAAFEAFFERTSLEVTLALKIPSFFLRDYYQEKLFKWIEKHANRCPSFNFDNIHFGRTVDFLKTRKPRFIEYSTYWNYSIHSMRNEDIVEIILKDGIPGEHPDPCIKITVGGPGWTMHVMKILTKNDCTLVIDNLERIGKKFMEHQAEVGWRLENSILESEAVGFTSRFDESKNLIFFLFENDDTEAELLIKYEPIERCI